MQTYHEPTKAEVKAALKVFWEELELLEKDPPFGQFKPNLILSNEPNYHRPVDPHYYAIVGQDVPPEPVKERLSARTVFCWICFWIIVGELVLLCWPGLF
jgi:hypothetical protein